MIDSPGDARRVRAAVAPAVPAPTASLARLAFRALALVCVFLVAGCVSAGRKGPSPAGLAAELRALSPTVTTAEANLTAETACAYSLQLAREYRVVRPAIFHNVLVNLGIRKRGLCFQWADDLSAKLETLHLQTLEIRRGVARLDTRREHSSVVLTAMEQPFEQGVVLDAWRHSGRLFWGAVRDDKYPWIQVDVLPEADAHPSLGQ